MLGGVPAASPSRGAGSTRSAARFEWSGAGAALAVFFFWGWDTAANVNEESKDADTSPGSRASSACSSCFSSSCLQPSAITWSLRSLNLRSTVPTTRTTSSTSSHSRISGTPITYLMVLAVLSSTVATVQTTLLPSSRLTYSMARDGVFPKAFGTVHKSWKTPWVGTFDHIGAGNHRHRAAFRRSAASGSVFRPTSSSTSDCSSPSTTASRGSRAHGHSERCCSLSLSLFIFAGLLPLLGGIFLLGFGYALIIPTTLPLGQSPDWDEFPIIITVLLGIPLVILAAMRHARTSSTRRPCAYVLVNGV